MDYLEGEDVSIKRVTVSDRRITVLCIILKYYIYFGSQAYSIENTIDHFYKNATPHDLSKNTCCFFFDIKFWSNKRNFESVLAKQP